MDDPIPSLHRPFVSLIQSIGDPYSLSTCVSDPEREPELNAYLEPFEAGRDIPL